MARSGPVVSDTSSLVLGLAQIRVETAATSIDNIQPVLSSTDSIGALANTKYMGPTDWARMESGFPLIEDYVVPIREAAHMEIAFNEVSPFTMALAHGIDPTGAAYSDVHSGEIALGGRTAPDFIRMEAAYTYPNGTNHMYIIFPRAQVSATPEIDLSKEDFVASPCTIEAKNASSDEASGNAVWDDKPLGRIFWD
jgi:hypothetical protein